jgi:hypothetical protein
MALVLTSLHSDSLQLHSVVSASRVPSITTGHRLHQQLISKPHHTPHLSIPPPNLSHMQRSRRFPSHAKTQPPHQQVKFLFFSCSRTISTLHLPNFLPTLHSVNDLQPHNSNLATPQDPTTSQAKPSQPQPPSKIKTTSHASFRKTNGVPCTCRKFEINNILHF